MKKLNHKVVILIVSVVITLIAGCNEQSISQSEIRKAKLIAVENKQLKKELEQFEKEIEKQKELVEKCLQEKKALEGKQKELVEKCLQEKKALEEEIQDEFNKLSERALNDSEEIIKLRGKNKKLKMEVGQLKTEITELKRELEMHKGPTPLPHTD